MTQFYTQFYQSKTQCSTQLPYNDNQNNEWKQTEQMDRKILVICTAIVLNFFPPISVEQFLDTRRKL